MNKVDWDEVLPFLATLVAIVLITACVTFGGVYASRNVEVVCPEGMYYEVDDGECEDSLEDALDLDDYHRKRPTARPGYSTARPAPSKPAVKPAPKPVAPKPAPKPAPSKPRK
jgi:hypothetical protein